MLELGIWNFCRVLRSRGLSLNPPSLRRIPMPLESKLLAGVARRCTNPPPNIAHGGWGAQKHEQAEGIDMDLWVTALAMADDASKALILDLDIQILTNQRADQIRAAVSQA